MTNNPHKEGQAMNADVIFAAYDAALIRAYRAESSAWDAWAAARDGRRSHKRRAHKLWRRRFAKCLRLERTLARLLASRPMTSPAG